MGFALKAMVVSLLCSAAWCARNADPVGIWEGESKCTVPDSPCHDEQAQYRIAADKRDTTKFRLDGYKIVDGKPEFMGTLECDYRASQSALSCTAHTPKQDDWEFQISGEAMAGTLTIGAEKTVYRRITLHKTHSE